MTYPLQFPSQNERPRRVARLPQCNKSNKLLRRFYSGRTIPPVAIARSVVVPMED